MRLKGVLVNYGQFLDNIIDNLLVVFVLTTILLKWVGLTHDLCNTGVNSKHSVVLLTILIPCYVHSTSSIVVYYGSRYCNPNSTPNSNMFLLFKKMPLMKLLAEMCGPI